jgi:hypothetical protein
MIRFFSVTRVIDHNEYPHQTHASYDAHHERKPIPNFDRIHFLATAQGAGNAVRRD